MSRKPNIVYILADDMGYGDLSCLNENSKIHTQHLDWMAEEGMRFTDAHATSAICTPSRYSILTGRYNWRSSLKRGALWGYSPPLIEPGRMTVASFLKRQGYHTTMIGKWHLGWNWTTTDGRPVDADGSNVDFTGPVSNGPGEYGFDHSLAISASLDIPPYVYVEDGRVTAPPDRETVDNGKFTWWRKGPTGSDFRHEEVLPWFTRRAVETIENRAESGNPFFLYLPLPAPHTPILPTSEFRGESGTNPYGDFCLQVDDTVGQVMDALERSGVAKDTVLIFASDNGCAPAVDLEQLKEFGHDPCHVFRGHKADIYEGGHRIPLLVRWPEEISPGCVCGETVCLADLLATCADIVGAELPDDAGEDSVSHLPLWRGREMDRSLREATVHSSLDGSFSIRRGRWKLEMCAGSGGWSYPRPGPECEGLPPVQLYDLQADIGERVNLYDQHPEVVEELKALLTTYVEKGRSTPGLPQNNTGGILWEQLWWMLSDPPDRPHAQNETCRSDV